MAQRLKVHGLVRSSVPVEESSRNVDNTLSRMHQVIGNRSDPLGVTSAAGASDIRQVARKGDQAMMRAVLRYSPIVPGVAADAVARRKGMGGAKSGLLRRMTLPAAAAGCRIDLITKGRLQWQGNHTAQIEGKEYSKSHWVCITGLDAGDARVLLQRITFVGGQFPIDPDDPDIASNVARIDKGN